MKNINKINELFGSELRVVNIGLNVFAKTLKSLKVKVVEVDWTPPANERMADMLKKLR